LSKQFGAISQSSRDRTGDPPVRDTTLKPLNSPPPFRRNDDHFAIDLPGVRAMFTTRRGGHSRGPYASLNLGLNTNDDPERVRANHEKLSNALGVELSACCQVHGTTIHRCARAPGSRRDAAAGPAAGSPPEAGSRPDTGSRPEIEPGPEADGQVTTESGLGPMVLVADCLPIVVGGHGGAAVLHGGWRGLAGGIIAKGVAELRAAGATGRLAAAIGPGVGGCCYEVGEDVHRVFAARHPTARRGANLDLKAIARAELAQAGVSEVHDLGMCTLCGDPALFFSHRRDGGVTGRQAGIAWLA
jgi:YfiH family protein